MKVWAAPALLILLTTAPLAAQDANSQERFQLALALHDAGKYDEAIAIYRELLAQSPDNETVKYELTFSTFAKGDFDGTIRLATEGASKRGPSQVHYLELLGNAYDSQHRTREAIDAYKRGIKIDPKYPRIHFNLGIAYSGQNKLRDAREELERAIELDPNYASPQLAIADVYRLDGYRIPAILAYARFLAIEPTGARVECRESPSGLAEPRRRGEGKGKHRHHHRPRVEERPRRLRTAGDDGRNCLCFQLTS